jgi:hypothetical protein
MLVAEGFDEVEPETLVSLLLEALEDYQELMGVVRMLFDGDVRDAAGMIGEHLDEWEEEGLV